MKKGEGKMVTSISCSFVQNCGSSSEESQDLIIIRRDFPKREILKPGNPTCDRRFEKSQQRFSQERR